MEGMAATIQLIVFSGGPLDGIDQYADVLRDEIRRPRVEFGDGFVEYFVERYVLDKDHQASEPNRDQFNRIIYKHKESLFTRKMEVVTGIKCWMTMTIMVLE